MNHNGGAYGVFKPRPARHIDRVFGFEEDPEAMRYVGTGAHFGKVCIIL
jgi:hypothetical protein